MTILTIRTDKPEAELGLFKDSNQLDYLVWLAHRELAETIHTKLKQLLDAQSIELGAVEAVVVMQGPGSFTGLRIGIAVANAFASALQIPIVGAAGDDWISKGVIAVLNGQNDKIVIPEYGALPNVSTPKK